MKQLLSSASPLCSMPCRSSCCSEERESPEFAGGRQPGYATCLSGKLLLEFCFSACRVLRRDLSDSPVVVLDPKFHRWEIFLALLTHLSLGSLRISYMGNSASGRLAPRVVRSDFGTVSCVLHRPMNRKVLYPRYDTLRDVR